MPGRVGKIRENFDGVLTVEWDIEGFLWWSSLDEYDSPPFGFSGSSWKLRIRHSGDITAVSSRRITICLCRRQNSPNLSVVGKFGLKKTDGTLCFSFEFTWIFGRTTMFGFKGTPTRSELLQRKRELLPSDTLTVVCVLRKPYPTPEDSTLSFGLKNLLDSQKHCDVTIQVGEQRFKAHKVILAAGSEVFAAMLDRGTEENDPRVVTDTDSDPGSFKDFLEFLYTGRTVITSENASRLYRTAHNYAVGELKIQCVAMIMQNMTVDDVCDVAALGDLCSDICLSTFCKLFFKDNFDRVLLTPKWQLLMKDSYQLANELLKFTALSSQ